ncbi:alanine racemase [Nonomuraea sp. NPDC000554]|uniref:alanine racemase n=1 Tax=Nonomuraea sp. NPDC000554 TaxID=3154259 RepID=UPI0033263388
MNEWARIRTPALVVDQATVEHNIDHAIARMGSPGKWRAHVKTARAAWAISRLLERGLTRLKASTTAELAAALATGAPDVLLAFPALGPARSRAAELAAAHPRARVSVLVDSIEALDGWTGGPLGAFLDVDPGMGRTGVPVRDHARALDVVAALTSRGIELRGLHTYDGHLADLPVDALGDQVAEGMRELIALARALESAGHPVRELVTGSTSTFQAVLTHPLPCGWAERLTLGPGTLVYSDLRTVERLGDAFPPAARVLARVVSRPRTDLITLDAGLTAIGVDAGHPHAAILGHPELRVGQPSQEHLIVEAREGAAPAVGALLWLVPRHVDTTVAQFDHMHVIGRTGDVRVEQVTARHHESP